VFESRFFMAVAQRLWMAGASTPRNPSTTRPTTIRWASPVRDHLRVHLSPGADLRDLALALMPHVDSDSELRGIAGLRAHLSASGVKLSMGGTAAILLTGVTPNAWDDAVNEAFAVDGVAHECFRTVGAACDDETRWRDLWPALDDLDRDLSHVGSALLRRAGLINSVQADFDAWHGHPNHVAGEFVLLHESEETRHAFIGDLVKDGAFQVHEQDTYHTFVRHVPSGQLADLRFLARRPVATRPAPPAGPAPGR
jgi:hypothetical protein